MQFQVDTLEKVIETHRNNNNADVGSAFPLTVNFHPCMANIDLQPSKMAAKESRQEILKLLCSKMKPFPYKALNRRDIDSLPAVRAESLRQ